MTLGLFEKDLLGRTTRIPVPRTLLDACLLRAIVVLAVVLLPSAAPGALGLALCLQALGPARRDGPAGWKQASGRSWKLLLAGSPDDCAGLARPSLEVLYLGKVPTVRGTLVVFVVAFLLEQHAASGGASQTLTCNVLYRCQLRAHTSNRCGSCAFCAQQLLASTRTAQPRVATAAATAARHHRADAKQP